MLQEIKEIIERHKTNPEMLFDEFFGFYEKIFFSQASINDGLIPFPSPLKELIAAHQAWGMIGSDGFDNYLLQVDEKFDKEVKAGLSLIGKENCYNALEEARAIFREKYEIPEAEEDRLWKVFYHPLREFESLAGKYLIKKYG